MAACWTSLGVYTHRSLGVDAHMSRLEAVKRRVVNANTVCSCFFFLFFLRIQYPASNVWFTFQLAIGVHSALNNIGSN